MNRSIILGVITALFCGAITASSQVGPGPSPYPIVTLTGDATGSGAASITTTVGSIGGKVITLGGALTTTGSGAITLAFPNSTAVYALPSVSKTLMASDYSNASLLGGDLGGSMPSPTVTSLSHAVGSPYTWTAAQSFNSGDLILNGSSSGAITVQPVAAAGTHTLTIPATTGTAVTTGDSGTVTNTMLVNPAVTVAGQTCTLGSSCGFSPTTTFLQTNNVSLSTQSAYFDVVNTGSIGGNGQVWRLEAAANLDDTAGGANFTCKITDHTNNFVGSEGNTGGALSFLTLNMYISVTQTGADTYYLQCQDRSSTSGLVNHAGDVGIGDLVTYITAKREK